MKTANELRAELVEKAIDILYVPAEGRLGRTVGIKRDASARNIMRRAERAIAKKQTQHQAEKAAKASRLVAYSQAVETESENYYNVDEHRLYRAQQNFVAAMVRGGHIDAKELTSEPDEN